MTLKEYLKDKTGNIAIPNEFTTEIDSYTKVPSEDLEGRKWYKVHYSGTDSKYCAFMVCPDTKQRRSTTFMEFYGSVVD